MSINIKKQSGLSGITTLLRKEALKPDIDLTKTEDKILNDEDNEDNNNMENIDKETESDINVKIYKLAKDLDIKIDGLGPDNVSNKKSKKTLLNKLDKKIQEIQEIPEIQEKNTRNTRNTKKYQTAI